MVHSPTDSTLFVAEPFLSAPVAHWTVVIVVGVLLQASRSGFAEVDHDDFIRRLAVFFVRDLYENFLGTQILVEDIVCVGGIDKIDSSLDNL